MDEVIYESGMGFIAENTFGIENSDCYKQLKDIKTVDLIRIKDSELLLIEAKTSFVNPQNPKNSAEEIQIEFSDICDKFIHSLHLYASIKTGVNHTPEALPSQSTNKMPLRFVLVISGTLERRFEEEWCIPIKKEIENQLRKLDYLAKFWKPNVDVINKEEAVAFHLVSPDR